MQSCFGNRISWVLGSAGHHSFLKHVSPMSSLQDTILFPGFNDLPILMTLSLNLEAGPFRWVDSHVKAPGHLFLEVPQDPWAQLLTSMPPSLAPPSPRASLGGCKFRGSKLGHSPLPHLLNPTPRQASQFHLLSPTS